MIREQHSLVEFHILLIFYASVHYSFQVQELLDEMGHPGVPLSIISKAAEIQLLDVVDKTLLGNKWLRKATGIQPKLPYLVDSFEERYGVTAIIVLLVPSNKKTATLSSLYLFMGCHHE